MKTIYERIDKPEIAEIIGVSQADWIKVNEDNAELRKVLESLLPSLKEISEQRMNEESAVRTYEAARAMAIIDLIEQTLSKGKTE